MKPAERAGLATLRAWATRTAATLPFGAFAPLLFPTDRKPGAIDDRADLLRRSAEALIEQAGDRPLVVFVDDAHLLDDASATLVHQLANSSAVFVLATVLTGVPAPDPVVALWKGGRAERIDVDGLPGEAVAELLSTVLGGPPDPDTASRLVACCQGNVLFLRELVIGALGDGALVEEDGRWHLRGLLSPSDRLIELVEARFAGLDPADRSLLELVAFGEPLGYAELTALGDPTRAERLERAGILSSRMNGRRLEVRPAHPLYADRAGGQAVRVSAGSSGRLC